MRLFNYRDIYWVGSLWQMLVMIAFLINILRTKNCSGISLKSQILYALVFTTRHLDLEQSYVHVENYVIKVVYLIATYGTVLSMYKFFSKTYDKQNDTSRIEKPIVSCILLSLILNSRFDFWEILMAFSVYLEVVAMIPQFEFVYKTERIEKSVFLYTSAMAIYAFFQIIFLCVHHSWHDSSVHDVAATTQFLLYCDFFRRIYPFIKPQDDDDQCTTSYCRFFRNIHSFLCSKQSRDAEADVEQNVETESSKTGYLASNVTSIVLTPSNLTGVHKDKGLSAATEEVVS